MHQDAYNAVYRLRPAGATRVYDVGSLDINGTVRPLFAAAERYLGVDRVPGPGVDVVADGETYDPPFEPDCVVCCEVLEHAERPRAVVEKLAAVLAPGGTLVITCAGPGRAPHSAVDGGRVQRGEHYGGIVAGELEAWLVAAGLEDVRVDAGPGVPGARLTADRRDADVYAVAKKGRAGR